MLNPQRRLNEFVYRLTAEEVAERVPGMTLDDAREWLADNEYKLYSLLDDLLDPVINNAGEDYTEEE